jgi:pimeloyl-ACP methyl ester carboxylesterase
MIREQIVDGIPVLLATPEAPRGELVLWMSYLGGSAAKMVPTLERFVAAGHPAVTFDAPGHGARSDRDRNQFRAEVFGSFRRLMWPLLGQTTLEAMRVLDWAAGQAPTDGTVLAGGFSMGGDVAVALAGIDPRVRRVAAIGSTPDWSRPGMCEIGDPSRLLDQGEADRYAQWYADQLDPMRHLDRYLDGVAITFELGAEDQHIPEANARDFVAALSVLDPAAGGRMRVRPHPGLDHGVIADPAAFESARDWLLER